MDIRKERLYCISISTEGTQYVWHHEDMPLFAKGNFIVQEEKVQFAYLHVSFTSTFLTLWTSAQGQIFVSAMMWYTDPVHVLTLPFESCKNPYIQRTLMGTCTPAKWVGDVGSWRLQEETRSCGKGRVEVAYMEFLLSGVFPEHY